MLAITLTLSAYCFLIMAIIVALIYYKRIVRAKYEYEEVKETFNDIIISFSRELKSATESLQIMTSKVNFISAKSEEALRKIASILFPLKAKKPSEKLQFWKEELIT